ncbi:unnamed protein product, partial [Polarella glacialis]
VELAVAGLTTEAMLGDLPAARAAGDAVISLAARLRDPQEADDVRAAAAWALGRLGVAVNTHVAVLALAFSLQEGCQIAARRQAEMETDSSPQCQRQPWYGKAGVDDPVIRVCRAASEALGFLGPMCSGCGGREKICFTRAVPALIGWLHARCPQEMKIILMWALSQIGPPVALPAVPPLCYCLND